MEKLVIKNFAGLDATFELRPITVLIGPQATGKSVVAKLLYYFRDQPREMIRAASVGEGWDSLIDQMGGKFATFFPLETWGVDAFEIGYVSDKWSLFVRGHRGTESSDEPKLELEFNETFKNVFQEISKEFQVVAETGAEENSDAKNDDQKMRWERSLEIAQKQFDQESTFQQIFVTAARAFFAQAKASVFTQLSEGGALDPFIIQFGSFLEQTRDVLSKRGFFGGDISVSPDRKRDIEQLHETLRCILRGKLIKTPNGEAVETGDGRIIPIAMASSGQQEALPLLLLMVRFFLVPHVQGRSIYVEEPEAHLFPSAQREVVDLLVETANRRNEEMQVVMTTHSPYILTSLNNLLQAGRRYAEATPALEKKLAKIVPKSRALASGRVAAYVLEGGKASSILDEETGLIDPEAIDSVSEILAQEFHKLLWEGK